MSYSLIQKKGEQLILSVLWGLSSIFSSINKIRGADENILFN